MPDELEQGVLYVSSEFQTAIHLCACGGCNIQTVTPLGPGEWTLTETDGRVTLRPSIGNMQFPCKSHYYITENRVEWL